MTSILRRSFHADCLRAFCLGAFCRTLPAVFLLLAPMSLAAARADVAEGSFAANAVPVIVTPIPLLTGQPQRNSVGKLTYEGGLSLASVSPDFGGLSGLVVLKDGQTVLTMSDRGMWFTARLVHKDDGRLSGITDVMSAPMLDWRGRQLIFGQNDSEGLTATDHEVYVSFEGFHRIWRYAIPDINHPEMVFAQTAIAMKDFPGLKEQPDNGGIEALAALPDGNVLAISEEARTKDGNARAWLVKGDEVRELSFSAPGNYRPTDATPLPNGDVLVLERRFTVLEGAGARLVHIPASAIRPGNVMTGEILAELTPPLSVDNMEGISAVPDGKGYHVYVVSDDNFNPLERTLLMEFSWTPDGSGTPQQQVTASKSQ